MRAWLEDPAYEGSTAQVTVAFTDQGGASFTPKTLTWTLMDGGQNVVNSRQDVVVASPAATVTVVLSGADLAMNDETLKRELRFIKFSGTYDSGSHIDLPFNIVHNFWLMNQEGE